MSAKKLVSSEWTIEDSAELYRVDLWGGQNFKIESDGHLYLILPNGKLNLHQLAMELEARGIELPTLVRFTDILQENIKEYI